MAQTILRLVKSNYEAEGLTIISGATLLALGSHFQMKSNDVKLSVNGSIFAPFDYNESTKIDTTYTYKFDKKCVLTLFDAVVV